VAEVVQIGVKGGVYEPKLVVRQFDRVHGGTLTDPLHGAGDGRVARGRPQALLYETFVRQMTSAQSSILSVSPDVAAICTWTV